MTEEQYDYVSNLASDHPTVRVRDLGDGLVEVTPGRCDDPDGEDFRPAAPSVILSETGVPVP